MTKKWFFALLGLMLTCKTQSQRIYSANSVLATGNWQKLAVSQPGTYIIDLPFLNSLGINTNNLASSSIRIFGNGGEMLSEACNGPKIDDLLENAIWISDGGDNSIESADYLLFYAPGPHEWRPEPSGSYRFQKNLFTDSAYYYINISTQGKRIARQPSAAAGTLVTSFDDRYSHELDTVNFLSSGKQWYGEEFGVGSGRVQTAQEDSRTWDGECS